MLRKGLTVVVAAGLLSAAVAVGSASAAPKAEAGPLRVAVYGDSPYGQTGYAPGNRAAITWQFEKTPAFIATMNADRSLSEVIQVGDIHSGQQFCTRAYDADIAKLWKDFEKPLVYTPGDNEWADCHKATSLTSPGEGGGFDDAAGIRHYIGTSGVTTNPDECVGYKCGNPLDNLDLIRKQFFHHPGHSLGSPGLTVSSQAKAFDHNFPLDAQYVENVMWVQQDVVFVTINVPGGSNNDADPWYKATTASQAQTDERTNRTAADIRWIDAAFARAGRQHAKGVVITVQADMWDLDGKDPSHLLNYEPIIKEIASKTIAFTKPVVMLNGDSHLYRSDNPMSPAAPCVGETDPASPTKASVCAHDAWASHAPLNLNVPNFHRIVVHGSGYDPAAPGGALPLEWLKLTIDSDADNTPSGTAFGPFSWERQQQTQLLPAP